jgi:membrane fusion protein (multidrug efflux system)
MVMHQSVEAPARNRWRQRLLMISVPLLVLAGGAVLWWQGQGKISTDNAYVRADKVSITSDVSGRVARVLVGENQPVAAGQLLVTLEPTPFRIAVMQAQANLASARLQVRQLQSGTGSTAADVAARREALRFAQIEQERQQQLTRDGFTTRARLQAADYAVNAARADLDKALADAARARAAADTGGGEGQHPLVLAAEAALARARLDLSRTQIHSPAAGIATQTTKVLPGQIMVVGVPAMSIVATRTPWVEANFKETDIGQMRVGMAADVVLDAWPGRPLHGRVASLGAGTGSEFSVLPAQNATGNWVKVVQRVPVRIALPPPQPGQPPLIAGLSATVTVHLQ